MNKISSTLKNYYKHKSKKSSLKGEKLINKFKSGVCSICGEKFTEKNWCLECQRNKFRKNFDNWSSKNQHIDNFIQSSQLNCINSTNYLVWIPFDDFINTKYLANGGVSAVYYALWDDYDNGSVRDVVLKRPHNDQVSNPEFLKEQVSVYLYASSKDNSIIKCHGFTLHPTEGYMLVFEYAGEGDLRGYLNANYCKLTWIDKISILRDVAKAMLLLHSKDYVHSDLHPGNILLKKSKGSFSSSSSSASSSKSSLALSPKSSPCKKKSVETNALVDLSLFYDLKFNKEIFGVIQYVAPEVFTNGQYTKSSDVYSFGLIMWELATGQTPFLNYSDDGNLVKDIINGKHFEALSNNKDIPKDYIDLMKKCWELEPTNRPTFQVIVTKIGEWMASPSKHFSVKKPKSLVESESADKQPTKRSKSIVKLPFSRSPSPLATNNNNTKCNGKTKSNNTNSNISSMQRYNSLSSKSLSKYVQQLENSDNNIDDINVRYNNYYDNNNESVTKFNNYISNYYGNNEYNNNNDFNNNSNDNQFSPSFNGNYLFK